MNEQQFCCNASFDFLQADLQRITRTVASYIQERLSQTEAQG
jgi:hypothetical protein